MGKSYRTPKTKKAKQMVKSNPRLFEKSGYQKIQYKLKKEEIEREEALEKATITRNQTNSFGSKLWVEGEVINTEGENSSTDNQEDTIFKKEDLLYVLKKYYF